MLEAVSVRSGKVVASRRFDRPLQGGPGELLLASYAEAADGVGQIEISVPGLESEGGATMIIDQIGRWKLIRLSGLLATALVAYSGNVAVARADGDPGSTAPCTLMCAMIVCPLQGFHGAWAPEQGDNPNGSSDPNGPHDGICYEFTCTAAHPCSPGGEPLMDQADKVEAAIDSGDAIGLQRLVSRSKSLFVDTKRGAVQVLDCGGMPAAHFPLPEQLLTQLLAHHQ